MAYGLSVAYRGDHYLTKQASRLNVTEIAVENATGKIGRFSLNAASGAIPFVGGFLAAIAATWGESEQENANKIMDQWIQMLSEELAEKGRTIAEIMARLDMQDQETLKRVESPEYQALLKKRFVSGHLSTVRLSARRSEIYYRTPRQRT